MENLREKNEDILKSWIRFREEDLLCHLTDEDRKYKLYFEEISEKILNKVYGQNKVYVEKQLELIHKNFIDYITYWNEKYYRSGFRDGIEIIIGCLKK